LPATVRMSKKDPECVKVVVRCRPLSRKEVEDQVSHARARFASFAWSVRCMCFPHRALLPLSCQGGRVL